MPEYRFELFCLAGEPPFKIAEETASVSGERDSEGELRLGIEIGAEFRKALQVGEDSGTIPDAESKLWESASQMTNLFQWWDVRNTRSLWLEIANTLADIRYQLAQARAYKALEPLTAESDGPVAHLRYYAHFAKMNHLNLSVFGLAKIQDLVVRLLFENFGGTLIPVDLEDEDWEKKLTLKEARKGLKQRLDSGELPAAEYREIIDALAEPSKSAHQDTVVDYRNRVAHRIRPSVDYPELFTEVEDRVGTPIFDSAGKETGRRYAFLARSKADFNFGDLYTALIDYLKHVVEMLTRLKKIPRLS